MQWKCAHQGGGLGCDISRLHGLKTGKNPIFRVFTPVPPHEIFLIFGGFLADEPQKWHFFFVGGVPRPPHPRGDPPLGAPRTPSRGPPWGGPPRTPGGPHKRLQWDPGGPGGPDPPSLGGPQTPPLDPPFWGVKNGPFLGGPQTPPQNDPFLGGSDPPRGTPPRSDPPSRGVPGDPKVLLWRRVLIDHRRSIFGFLTPLDPPQGGPFWGVGDTI